MKYTHKILNLVLCFSTVLFLDGCKSVLDINTDPNNPTTAANDLLLTNSEVAVMSRFASQQNDLASITGMVGVENFSRSNNSYDFLWTNMYSTPLQDIEKIIAGAQLSPVMLGIAQTLKAYSFATMVDLYGDLPFSQALQGDAATPISNPTFDKDADVYNACLALLDQAIVNLAKSSPVSITGDIIYSGSAAKWTKLANTLKLKLLITGRLAIPSAAAQINSLITAGGFITGTGGDDFTFQFSKDPTSNRHPWFTGNYTGGEFTNTYVDEQIMVEMLEDGDPRWPFYFRRQYSGPQLNVADPTDRSNIPGFGFPTTYGYIIANPKILARLYTNKGKTMTKADSTFIIGVFGRDRGDASGLPQDQTYRTIPGVYPAGGYYDVTAAAIPAAEKATGGGIFPALTSVNVKYYTIEAILKTGATGDAKAIFESAIREHIAKVAAFGASADANSVAPAKAVVDTLVSKWLARWDATADNDGKLNVAMKQLWFSSWGNAFEVYNSIRRTGYPNTLQIPIVKEPRGFPLRLPYSSTELARNPNAANYKNVIYDKDKIFWGM